MKIIIDRNNCIGCASCTRVCPKLFKIADDGRASLKGGEVQREGSEKEELVVSEKECAGKAVEICPVQCIKIID